jgi:hypothetical protein
LESIGFKYDYPKEFSDLFKPDYDKMFEKSYFKRIERFYDNVGWKIRKPAENVTVELFDLFSLNRHMALQPGGYTDRPEDDNTHKAHPAFNRGKVRGILETLSIIKK